MNSCRQAAQGRGVWTQGRREYGPGQNKPDLGQPRDELGLNINETVPDGCRTLSSAGLESPPNTGIKLGHQTVFVMDFGPAPDGRSPAPVHHQ